MSKTINTKTYLLLILVMFLFQIQPVFSSKEIWELLFQPRQRTVRSLGVYRGEIFLGTGNGVLVSKDEGQSWENFDSEQLLKDENGNSIINWIHINEEEQKIYIATSYGAYESDINNPDWELIFDDIKTGSKEVNSLFQNKNNLYFCTNDGFWICDKKKSCARLNNGLAPDSQSGNILANFAIKENNNLYLAASNGIYLFNENKQSWEKISNDIKGLSDGQINAKHLLIEEDGKLWAACETGIYLTTDSGLTWEDVSNGIRKNSDGFKQSYYLHKDKDSLYAACASGIFIFNKESKTWEDISNGIRTNNSLKNVYWLTSFENNLFAATDEGLFVLSKSIKSNAVNKLTLKGKIENDFANLEELEPSVIEVQKKALEFAALPTSNDYKRYRLQARLRNIVPMIGFDLNNTDTSTDYSQFEKGISSDIALNNDYNAAKTNRSQLDGRSFKQLSVAWNTNEFIYDDEIKEILSQARLTANIRENLLDDVTRIYFQRKRLQLESLTHKSEKPSEKLIQELEIAELTGQLDSRTGGWFSKEVKKKKEELSLEK